MLLAVVAACSSETVEVPGETVVVEKVVTETVEVPGETVVVEKEVIRTVEVPGETVTKEVVKEVMVPGETVVVEKEVVKTVEVPGQTVVKEVVKTVEVPGQTVVVEKEVVKTVEVPGETVVVTKEVAVPVEVVREVPSGKNYVTDPTTGKTVEAPRYGGTFTQVTMCEGAHSADPASSGVSSEGVLENLGIGDWVIDRDEFSFDSWILPVSVIKGKLAESWDISPDGLTYTFHIRKGVYWHDKPPMNGRELTADDIEYSFHRYAGMGKFTEDEPYTYAGLLLSKLPLESIKATDKWTVVFKLTEPHLGALPTIVGRPFILPQEVIEQHGDLKDWRNLVGTGPFMLTDWVFGSSITFDKNPDYWAYDEKYPENRLPYVDQFRLLVIKDRQTILAAMRSGKIDLIGRGGCGEMSDVNAVEALLRTNPEIQVSTLRHYNILMIAPDIRKPPFNDIRVRIAMQKALDLETINRTWGKGWGTTKPQGMVGRCQKGSDTPFEEWPEEIKERYTYDPAAAEALLDEAGFARGADGIRFKTTWEYSYRKPISYAEIVVEYFRAIGIEVEIFIQDAARASSSVAEHTYEGMVAGQAAQCANPEKSVGSFHSENLAYGGWNWPGIQDPVYDAMVEAAHAATTIEEQQRLVREADKYYIEKQWQIWGVFLPQFSLLQPWVKGHNHEIVIGSAPPDHAALWARIWIDQELKEAMGH